MAWYDTGTVSVTNGSTAVVGSGTDFISAKVQVGEAFYGPDGKIYEIAAIVSSTSLTLADNYLGTTQSGQTYKIVPTQSLVADLATNVSTLITDFANVRDLAGEGKFDDGTVAAPGITFNLDQDNGLYRIGANNWAMAVGGSKIVDLTSTGFSVTGNVGIGTASPNTPLQVSGANSSTNTDALFSVQKTTEGYGLFSGVLATGVSWLQGGTSDDLTYYNLALQPNGGNVGIGITSPGVKLHVEGDTNSNVMVVNNIGTAPNYIFDVRDDGVSQFRVDPNGNVGIDATPSSWGSIFKSLDIRGSSVSSTTAGALVQSGNAYYNGTNWIYKVDGPATRVELNASTSGSVWYTAASGTAGSAITWSESMRIDASGHVIAPYGVTLGTAAGTYNAANTLDDYEEGTFTATLTGGTSQPTPQKTGSGYYTKIGRSVEITIAFENVDTTGYAGSVDVTGVPFANNYGRAILSVGSYSLATWSSQLIAVMQNGTTSVELLDINSGGAWADVEHSAGTTRYLWINGVFQTND